MSRLLFLALLLIFIFPSCAPDRTIDPEKWKQEIVNTELAFSEMARTEGIPTAFLTFAADDVVVLRGDKLIKGKDELKASYEKRFPSGEVSLTWTPDFVDVSSSGDLGYTYGKFIYTSTDTLGIKKSTEGIFHTVWKRQADRKWKFVWD